MNPILALTAASSIAGMVVVSAKNRSLKKQLTTLSNTHDMMISNYSRAIDMLSADQCLALLEANETDAKFRSIQINMK